MTIVFFLALILLAISLISGLSYGWQYHYVAPKNYRRLKLAGRFKEFPETWEELEQRCNEPLMELEQTAMKVGGMEDRRVLYRRFIKTELMPAGFALHLGAFGITFGGVLLVIWGIGRLLF